MNAPVRILTKRRDDKNQRKLAALTQLWRDATHNGNANRFEVDCELIAVTADTTTEAVQKFLPLLEKNGYCLVSLHGSQAVITMLNEFPTELSEPVPPEKRAVNDSQPGSDDYLFSKFVACANELRKRGWTINATASPPHEVRSI